MYQARWYCWDTLKHAGQRYASFTLQEKPYVSFLPATREHIWSQSLALAICLDCRSTLVFDRHDILTVQVLRAMQASCMHASVGMVRLDNDPVSQMMPRCRHLMPAA